MAQVFYPAIADNQTQDGSYGVVFPDLPGCYSAGETLEAAIKNAHEAAALYFDDWTGGPPPAPSSLHSAAVPENVIEAARFLVLVDTPDKPQAVTISIDRGLLARIDRKAKAMGMTRSGFLAQGARTMLGRDR
jgi:predicted RNase H-like HicB family nuclease